MKSFEALTNAPVDEEECAALLMDVVPLVMRSIRAEMRRHRADLSVPQFRTLAFLRKHEGASLSQVADHLGLMLPSVSKMVDGLVARGLLTRKDSSADRRYVALALTARGRSALASARKATQLHLAQILRALPQDERPSVVRAMEALRPVFAAEREAARERER
jgi:DNA-binding MarR family transcriptional regulator